MAKTLTTDDLIQAVRSRLDEENNSHIDDVDDILPALNRALDDAANILARQYDSPLMAHTTIETVAGTHDYLIPEDAFEDRLEKVEAAYQSSWYEIPRMSVRDMTTLDTRNSSGGILPVGHGVYGRYLRIVPPPSTAITMRVWYLRTPEMFVKSLGRVTRVDVSAGNLFVDAAQEGLSSDVDSLEAFVNIVDGRSGQIKGSAQVLWVNGNAVQFKSTIDPEYGSLMGKTITAISDFELAPEIGDYICNIEGTCIPFMSRPVNNYLIQYAVVELRKKIGEDTQEDMVMLKKAETALERTWVGRENGTRIKNRNHKWDRKRWTNWR